MDAVLPVNLARRNLGQIVEEAFYLDKVFALTRSKRPMAMVLSNKLFAQMVKAIEQYDQALADTIALMSNPELQAILEEDDQHPETTLTFDERVLANGDALQPGN